MTSKFYVIHVKYIRFPVLQNMSGVHHFMPILTYFGIISHFFNEKNCPNMHKSMYQLVQNFMYFQNMALKRLHLFHRKKYKLLTIFQPWLPTFMLYAISRFTDTLHFPGRLMAQSQAVK